MAPRVLVCRGRCCGTQCTHPDTDYDAEVEALRSVALVREPVTFGGSA